jgi:GH15 family glucan-1,4-alpha-glucosidase
MSISSNDRLTLARHSVAVIKANQASTGAYLASPNFRVYRYSWLRDGAFIADAMSRAGHAASAEAFFGWCTRILTARAAKIESLIERHRFGQPIQPDEFLHARYTVDGKEAREEWWNFQLDGYGTWLWALSAHHSRSPNNSLEPYQDGIVLSIKYLTEFWREPSYDWWEEHPGHRHTSTLAPIFAAMRDGSGWDEVPKDLRLRAADAADEIRQTVLSDGRREGRLVKWLGGDALDASLISCSVPFGLLAPEDPLMATTVAEIESNLANGGVHRYLADTYYGGGEWPLLSALLGWYYSTTGRRDDAYRELDWVVRHASRHGDLPEQVADRLLAPSARQAWIDRWGPVATPLLWSHAMYLTLALELGAVASPVLLEE